MATPPIIKLYVGNLPDAVTYSNLRHLFQPFGVIADIFIPTKRSGYAFVVGQRCARPTRPHPAH
jgi:RNA recognition motif-containing protein